MSTTNKLDGQEIERKPPLKKRPRVFLTSSPESSGGIDITGIIEKKISCTCDIFTKKDNEEINNALVPKKKIVASDICGHKVSTDVKKTSQLKPEGDHHNSNHQKSISLSKSNCKTSQLPPPTDEGTSDSQQDNLPKKLMMVLQDEAAKDALWWMRGGCAFAIHPEKFSSKVLKRYFQGIKYESFIRSLRRWGFKRLPGKGAFSKVVAYHHTFFQKDSPLLLDRFDCAKGGNSKLTRERDQVNTSVEMVSLNILQQRTAPAVAMSQNVNHVISFTNGEAPKQGSMVPVENNPPLQSNVAQKMHQHEQTPLCHERTLPHQPGLTLLQQTEVGQQQGHYPCNQQLYLQAQYYQPANLHKHVHPRPGMTYPMQHNERNYNHNVQHQSARRFPPEDFFHRQLQMQYQQQCWHHQQQQSMHKNHQNHLYFDYPQSGTQPMPVARDSIRREHGTFNSATDNIVVQRKPLQQSNSFISPEHIIYHNDLPETQNHDPKK